MRKELEEVKNAASVLCRLNGRDTYVSIEGRPKPEEWGMAWQKLSEALGFSGTSASQERS